MRATDQLAGFVEAALDRGQSRDAIAKALAAAGWSGGEISAALAAWAEGEFRPPVPLPRSFFSAKEAFQYAILFVALATVSWNITSLGFALIDRMLPEPGMEAYLWYGTWTIRWAVATLIVALPIFLLLNRHMNLLLSVEPFRRRSALRKWVGYVTLFLAAVTLAGDLVTAIYSLLNGDLTLRVMLKVLLVLVTAGLVFWYYVRQMEDASHAV